MTVAEVEPKVNQPKKYPVQCNLCCGRGILFTLTVVRKARRFEIEIYTLDKDMVLYLTKRKDGVFMFYVLALLCKPEGRGLSLQGVRLLDSKKEEIIDVSGRIVANIMRESSSKDQDGYIDLLEEVGSELLTEYEIRNKGLKINDKSGDSYTLLRISVEGFSFEVKFRDCYVRSGGDIKTLLEVHREYFKGVEKKYKVTVNYVLEKDRVAFYLDYGYARTLTGYIDEENFVMVNEHNFLDRNKLGSLVKFEKAFNKKWKTAFDMTEIMSQWGRASKDKRELESKKKRLLSEAKDRGFRSSSTLLAELNKKGQRGMGSYAIKNNQGYIFKLVFPEILIFDLTDKLERELFDEEKKKILDKVWCYYGSSPDSVTYVTNYKGESHGYICVHCKRFKQIG